MTAQQALLMGLGGPGVASCGRLSCLLLLLLSRGTIRQASTHTTTLSGDTHHSTQTLRCVLSYHAFQGTSALAFRLPCGTLHRSCKCQIV